MHTQYYTGFDLRRKVLMIIAVTLIVGQVHMLEAQGLLEEVTSLYRTVVWLVLLYAFGPELNWLAHGAFHEFRTRIGGEVVDV